LLTSNVAIATLPDLGFLCVHGEDAQRFLQGQLSQDMGTVTPDRSALAAWHDAKGRVRALFRVLRLPERYVLATSARAVPDVFLALRRFVLRAHVQIEPMPDWCGIAIIGESSEWLSQHAIAPLPADGAVAAFGEAWCLRIGATLCHAYGPAAAIAALDVTDEAPETAVAAEIRLGLPDVPPEIAGEYVPHMLNLDRLGALSFDKGCYPGQEVVARTEHLGTVKRRARAFRGAPYPAPSPGAELVDVAGATVGHVIRSALGDDALELLAVVTLDRLDEAVFLAAKGAPPLPLEPIPLPFD
jgi:folate-binding protein YgfZ